jgi:23S rRNA (pseudouridine1915-N3)-methyltransferase
MLGKTRRPEMRVVLEDYVKRIGHQTPIEIIEIRDGEAAARKLDAERAATVMLLDANGKRFSSEAFAKWIGEKRDCGMRELIFVCGDADGFPAILLERKHPKFSLSEMTYSHELARVMLAEQIYRAFAILAGSSYPK